MTKIRVSSKQRGRVSAIIKEDVKKIIAQRKKTKWKIALRKAMNVILRQAKINCPEDTRELVKSGRVEYSNEGMTAKVIFGNAKAWYALIVHEQLGVTYQKATAIPKFLEIAVIETQKEVEQIFNEAMK